jgi:N-carbamoyl-L-amino-acid hydrolase
MASDVRIDGARLMKRIFDLAKVGEIDGGGVCRLALTDEDRAGRDLVVGWMRALGLEVAVDAVGNAVGVWRGERADDVVMTGSHIDTVRTGGKYDGNLGVLAGLEVVETLRAAGVRPVRSLAVAFFTNEEGSRFAPDMMGSAVYTGVLGLDEALATKGIDGTTVRENLRRIGYEGEQAPGFVMPSRYVELHVEQGPVLEREGFVIGAVEGVQGISWTEVTLGGTSNHAGTTPMSMRCDAGYVAAEIVTFVRRLAHEIGHPQVATVGALTLRPNLVNVVPNHAVMTVDLRHTDEAVLKEAEARTFAFIEEVAAKEGASVSRRTLARFEPVAFAPEVVARVEETAKRLGHSVRRLPSGAGHDAQMFAPRCPTGMIFVPSQGGISHNVKEHTAPAEIEAGANVLLDVLHAYVRGEA